MVRAIGLSLYLSLPSVTHTQTLVYATTLPKAHTLISERYQKIIVQYHVLPLIHHVIFRGALLYTS